MLSCKNAVFKKFLFFSFAFLLFSALTCSVMSHTAYIPIKQTKARKEANQIQIQQRTILDRLERMEDKLSYQIRER